MSSISKEMSPMLTPDSLRKLNQLNKSLYGCYTKKNYSKTDSNGYKYAGTIENFGNELLIEARKIKMEKPPLESTFDINHYKYYFDLKYSGAINTYDQQNMIEALLKKDVLLSNKKYSIQFDNCEDIYIARSRSWGSLNPDVDSDVYKNKYIHTTTPPTLIIKNEDDVIEEEIVLSLRVNEESSVDYYFFNEFATSKFIKSYTNGTLITEDLTDADVGLCFVWICVNNFNTMPDIGFVGNISNDKPILTIGTDGQNIHHIYPCIYENTLPEQTVSGSWYLYAKYKHDGSMLNQIECVYISSDNIIIDTITIEFNTQYIKISTCDKIKWDIVDDHTKRISMDQFFTNSENDSILIEAFDLYFSTEFLYSEYEYLCENAVSGIYIGMGDNISNNGIPKEKGIIHGLNHFDGLPKYLDGYEHSRVILYLNRDRINKETQLPESKQTVGIILDTGDNRNNARCYYIGNDDVKYKNIEKIENSEKPSPLTLARICDIPTEYGQLIHINNVAPTYLFDENYVRTETNFTIDEMDMLLNRTDTRLVIRARVDWIYKTKSDLPSKQEIIDSGYYRTSNTHNSYIPITTNHFEVFNSGTGYSIDDEFIVLVGGKAYDGKVSAVLEDGSVTSITLTVPDDSSVSIYNITGTATQLTTYTTSSANGKNLKLQLVLSQYDIAAHSLAKNTVIPPEGLIGLVMDNVIYSHNIHIYKLNLDWSWEYVCQISGIEVIDNPYDYQYDRNTRTFNYAFFDNLLKDRSMANDQIYFNQQNNISFDLIENYSSHEKVDEKTDLSDIITNRNNDNTFYQLKWNGSRYDLEISSLKPLDDFNVTLPRFNKNNTIKEYNTTNRLYISNSSLNNIQPTLFMYSPSRDHRIDSYTTLTDMVLVSKYHNTNYNDYGEYLTDNQKLTANVYEYPTYDFVSGYHELENELSQLNRESLIEYIKENIGEDVEPLLLENSVYGLDDKSLISYIMKHYPSDIYPIKDNIRFRDQYDSYIYSKMIHKPTGGVVSVTAEELDNSYTIRGREHQAIPFNIFIIEDPLFAGFDDSMRIHDENNIDITESSIVIWNNVRYIFQDGEWISLVSQNT